MRHKVTGAPGAQLLLRHTAAQGEGAARLRIPQDGGVLVAHQLLRGGGGVLQLHALRLARLLVHHHQQQAGRLPLGGQKVTPQARGVSLAARQGFHTQIRLPAAEARPGPLLRCHLADAQLHHSSLFPYRLPIPPGLQGRAPSRCRTHQQRGRDHPHLCSFLLHMFCGSTGKSPVRRCSFTVNQATENLLPKPFLLTCNFSAAGEYHILEQLQAFYRITYVIVRNNTKIITT